MSRPVGSAIHAGAATTKPIWGRGAEGRMRPLSLSLQSSLCHANAGQMVTRGKCPEESTKKSKAEARLGGLEMGGAPFSLEGARGRSGAVPSTNCTACGPKTGLAGGRSSSRWTPPALAKGRFPRFPPQLPLSPCGACFRGTSHGPSRRDGGARRAPLGYARRSGGGKRGGRRSHHSRR
jgi:hypothetical protein